MKFDLFTLTGLFIFSGSFLALIMALQQIFVLKRKAANYILFFLCLVTSLLLFEYYIDVHLGLNENIIEKPLFSSIMYSIEYLKYALGPLIYIYFKSIVERSFNFSKRDLLHFIPLLFFIIGINCIVILYLMFRSEFLLVIYDIIHVFSILHFIIYTFITIKKININSILIEKKNNLVIYIYIIIGFCILMSIAFTLFVFTGNNIIERIGLSIVSLMVMVWFFMGYRRPEFIHTLSLEVRKNRYERSLINGLDITLIKGRLYDIMEEEKVYCDEDLNLKKLAHYLNISPHQLSEILNNVLKINFSNFINKYRIEEAKRLLIDEPYRSIASIAYASGFNSISVFYNVFSNLTGTTPKALKKAQTAK